MYPEESDTQPSQNERSSEEPATSQTQSNPPGQGNQYHTEFKDQVGSAAVGENAQVMYNYGLSVDDFGKLFNLFRNQTGNGSFAGSSPHGADDQTSLVGKLSENIKADMQNAASADETPSFSSSESALLPQTRAEIIRWYYDLNEYEQCFVQAAAALHGTSMRTISEAARELYTARPLKQVVILPEENDETSNTPTAPEQASQSSIDLLTRTYTVSRRIRSSTRIFWCDTDAQGNSAFSQRVLYMLAEEAEMAIGENQDGRVFLTLLEQWTVRLKGDASWRATRALGIVHWTHSEDDLRVRANSWAASASPQDWQRAASYLTGVYESTLLLDDTHADDPRRSVHWLLEQWTQRAHKKQMSIGRAAARTYGLIGRRDPQSALIGLDTLLGLGTETEPQPLQILSGEILTDGISNYLTPIWSGHIRPVLASLAKHSEYYVLYTPSGATHLSQVHLMKTRMLGLTTIFNIFLPISAASLSAAKRGLPAPYNQHALPEQPRLPDEQGHDLLLAGILARDENLWRTQLTTILAAMLAEGKDESAFQFLREWADIVLSNQLALEDREAAQAKLARFIVEIGARLYSWRQQNVQVAARLRNASTIMKRRLTLWQSWGRTRRHPLGTFAQQVLSQLK